MNIPFIGGAYLDRYGKINHQESQNLFPTVDSETGKVNAIIGTPGLELWAAPGTEEVRGMHVFGSYLYAVVGHTLYKIDTSGTATAMTGTIPYGNDLLTNGNFETAGGGGFATWDETVTGTTTANRDVTTYRSGASSLRVDHVLSTEYAYVSQNITLVPGQYYRFRGYYKTATNKSINLLITDVAWKKEVTLNGIWQALYNGITLPPSTTWKLVDIIFPGIVGYESCCLVLRTESSLSAGSSFYWDDVSLEPYNHCQKVWFQNNGTDLMLVGGDKAYYLSGTTVTEATQLTAINYPTSLAYQDGYFIATMKDSEMFFISESYGAVNWDASEFDRPMGDPDNLQCVISENRELWLLGKTSYEVWYFSGDSEFPFDRISGAVRKIGCIAPNSACGFMGTVVWLDDRRYVRASNGYNAEKVSTSQVDYHLASYTKVDDAVGYTYSQEGHTFYVLTFPTEDKTWVYDFSTKYWHTRASGELDNRHPANCYAKFDDKHLIGDYSNGRIYYYDLGKYTDNGATLHRVRSARAIRDDRKRVYHSRFELDFDLG